MKSSLPLTVQMQGIEEQFLAVEMGERNLRKHLNPREWFQLRDRAGRPQVYLGLRKGGMTRQLGEDHPNRMFAE